ncbi:MAG: two-component sensor histidine kinase [Flavisolibacter sp.]|nr:two-component sensor histidine kinase [Flavisolibacter sp.]
MFLLQVVGKTSGIPVFIYFGTLAMVVLVISIILFIIFHQKKVHRFQMQMQWMEQQHQKVLLDASIRFQEEERQRLAADLHDDAGPLLATARLYLNENLVNMDKATQLQSIFQARQILDDTIQLIRNISHSLMPPTLKNFGLESAVNDLFQKISGSGSMNASSRFHDYKERIKPEKELIVFRIVQELVNNILKHSKSSFIHVTQNMNNDKFILRMHHDGKGLTQTDFEKLSKSPAGLGLKNIASRLRVAHGKIFFEKDPSQTYYKITIEIPVEDLQEPQLV